MTLRRSPQKNRPVQTDARGAGKFTTDETRDLLSPAAGRTEANTEETDRSLASIHLRHQRLVCERGPHVSGVIRSRQ